MEVRIKDNNGYVAADWTIEDGIMVVSPKVEKFEPKDGDVVSIDDGSQIFVCKNYLGHQSLYAYFGFYFESNCFYEEGHWSASRFATEEGKKKLFDKLSEEGYEWKADTKELVKLKWKPKEGEEFWLPLYYASPSEFKPITSLLNKERDKETLNKGWCFKIKEECQEFCNRLNDAINSVKP